MPETYDCIVIGVCGCGSSALYHLARRGVRVLGLEQFGIAHDRGSSHGETRIIRLAYFEHPDYVPLLKRAYQLWQELQDASGTKLYHPVGMIETGLPESELVAGVRLADRTHDLGVEEISLTEARRRFPGFHFPDGYEVLFEHEAGFLAVEDCVRAHIDAAKSLGAELRTNERVLSWQSDGRTVVVRTEQGEYHAGRLVITAGAWAQQILSELNMPLQVLRKVLFWFETTSNVYDLGNKAPVFAFDGDAGFYYGFPSLDGKTVKLAEHCGGTPLAGPEQLDRAVYPEDSRPVVDFVRRSLPALRPEPVRSKVCMYTCTPDYNFIIDRHPQHANVAIGAAFSGHGFKLTSVMGEVLAELAMEGRSQYPVEFLGLARPALKL